mgnify:FL=1
MSKASIEKQLKALGNTEIASHSQGFFKTGPGEYGAGDVFLGIRVPVLRKQVKGLRAEPLAEVLALLQSGYHEARLLALLLLVDRFERGDEPMRHKVYEAYLSHTVFINNWDLVDASAHKIVGAYLQDKPRAKLYELAGSDLLWEKRMAMIATFWFIKDDDFTDALALAEQFLHEPHDLMHKAVGWGLREVGKRQCQGMEGFLLQHYHTMPRTMLRYAIEKLPEARRQEYLKGTI